jgi:hypothetical protein
MSTTVKIEHEIQTTSRDRLDCPPIHTERT